MTLFISKKNSIKIRWVVLKIYAYIVTDSGKRLFYTTLTFTALET
jgi:hypothetical protein